MANYNMGFLTPNQYTSTDMVNSSVSDGINRAKAQNAMQVQQADITQRAQQMANAGQTVTAAAGLLGLDDRTGKFLSNVAMQRQYGSELTNAKKAWEEAQYIEDDDARANMLDEISKSVGRTRQAAAKAGVDVSAFGADRSLGDSLYALKDLDTQAFGNVVGGMDSGAYYNKEYSKYISAGMTPEGADKAAAAKAYEYQRNRIQGLSAELFTKGLADKYHLNPYGEMLKNAIYQENPNAISVVQGDIPTLADEYKFGNESLAKDQAFQNAVGLADVNGKWRVANTAQAGANSLGVEQQKGINSQTLAAMQYQFLLDHPELAQYVGKGGSKGGNGGNASNGNPKKDNAKALGLSEKGYEYFAPFKSAYIEAHRLLNQQDDNLTEEEFNQRREETGNQTTAMREALNKMLEHPEEYDADSLAQFKQMTYDYERAYQKKFDPTKKPKSKDKPVAVASADNGTVDWGNVYD